MVSASQQRRDALISSSNDVTAPHQPKLAAAASDDAKTTDAKTTDARKTTDAKTTDALVGKQVYGITRTLLINRRAPTKAKKDDAAILSYCEEDDRRIGW